MSDVDGSLLVIYKAISETYVLACWVTNTPHIDGSNIECLENKENIEATESEWFDGLELVAEFLIKQLNEK